jgi:tRNA(Ile)-lysidine synthase
VAEEIGAPLVYLAHHRDDQVETIVLRLLQGVPPDRVTGMRPVHGLWARPLLGVYRSRLRSLAESNGWTWREDASNQDESRLRNRVRASVLPGLRAGDPQFDEAVLQAASAARSRREETEVEVARIREACVRMEGAGAARLDVVALRSVPRDVALGLLQRLCDPGDLPRRPPNRAALGALLDAAPGPSRRFDLGGGWTARIEADELRLLRDGPLSLEAEAPPEVVWAAPETSWDRGRWQLSRRLVDLEEAHALLRDPGAGLTFALFDADRVETPLSVVAAPPSRRMHPYGLDGSVTVRRILAEAGVPRSARAARPAVVDAAGRVLWLPGVRAASVGALDKHSRQALLLYTEESPDLSGGSSRTGLHAESP